MADADLDSARRRMSDRELLENIDRKVDRMTAGLTALQAQVAELTTEDAEILEAVEAAVEGFATIEQELESLKNTGETTDEELAPVTEAVSNAATALTTAIGKLHAAIPPAPTPPAPIQTPESVYLHLDASPVEAPWGPAPYVTAEAVTVNGVVIEVGASLFYDSNDTQGAQPPTTAGAEVPGWALYTGAVTATA